MTEPDIRLGEMGSWSLAELAANLETAQNEENKASTEANALQQKADAWTDAVDRMIIEMRNRLPPTSQEIVKQEINECAATIRTTEERGE